MNKIKSGKRRKTVLKRESITSVDYINKHATRSGGASRSWPEWRVQINWMNKVGPSWRS